MSVVDEAVEDWIGEGRLAAAAREHDLLRRAAEKIRDLGPCILDIRRAGTPAQWQWPLERLPCPVSRAWRMIAATSGATGVLALKSR
ncbi:hypothetical protein DW2_00095 [Thioclava atlantica]|uniref:Uncharacterized protein n=1 Tax=Thioclava atlantica TaxID=1317124 RepID=A0A085U0L4_9RHOB|nr:hypothetical protein DW2_00095 [Thioclava atlantica]